MNINIIEAKEEDLNLIYSYIKKIAHYEKMDEECLPNINDLRKWLFLKNLCKTLFITLDSKIVGFCIYYYNFSTFVGKAGIHIEDIYIDEEYRNLGLGSILFKEIIKIAKKEDLGRIEWTCLKWNEPSKKFYEAKGARNMDEWITYRLVSEQFDELIK